MLTLSMMASNLSSGKEIVSVFSETCFLVDDYGDDYEIGLDFDREKSVLECFSKEICCEKLLGKLCICD